MTKHEFKRLLAGGHGRAAKFILENGPDNFEQEIIDACIRPTYPQIDVDPGPFLANLVLSLSNPDEAVRAIIAVCDRRSPRYLRRHRRRVLLKLAQRRHPLAVKHIESRWKRALMKGNHSWAEDYVDLGTEKRYERVLRFVAKMSSRRKFDDISFIHFSAESALSRAKAETVRQRVLADYPELDQLIDPPRTPKKEPETEAPILLEGILDWAKQHPEANIIRYTIRKRVSDETIVELAQFIVDHPDHSHLALLLTAFRGERTWPLEIDPIIEFARGDNTPLTRRAVQVLACINNARIRELAIEFNSNSKRRWQVPDLLESSFQFGDEPLILSVLRRTKNLDRYHSAALSSKVIIDANPNAEFQAVLLHLYENVPCEVCRWSVCKFLDKRRLLIPEMAEEMLFDSEEETRKIAKKFLRRKRTQQTIRLLTSLQSAADSAANQWKMDRDDIYRP